jgi:small subunit ribosomal protein S16
LVKIRLKRMGTTKRPFYRLVVADSRSPRDGRFIEALGYYDPLPQPASVKIDADRVREWLRRGARPSDSARDLLVAQGILAGNPKRERGSVGLGAAPALEETAAEAKPVAAATVSGPVAAKPKRGAAAAESEPVASEPEPVAVAAESEPVAAEPEPVAAAAESEPGASEPEPVAAAAESEAVEDATDVETESVSEDE